VTQTEDPTALVVVPGGQAEQAAFPRELVYWPRGHLLAVDIPSLAQAHPTGHLVGADMPLDGQTYLAGHLVGAEDEARQEKPSLHWIWDAERSGQWCPAEQGFWTDEPAGQ
jgi:hypothetical protein